MSTACMFIRGCTPDVRLTLAQRRRRWANVSLALARCQVFAGIERVVHP